MKINLNGIASIVFITWWVTGLVLAKGIISTTAAIFIPPWSMYLVVEKYLVPFLDTLQ